VESHSSQRPGSEKLLLANLNKLCNAGGHYNCSCSEQVTEGWLCHQSLNFGSTELVQPLECVHSVSSYEFELHHKFMNEQLNLSLTHDLCRLLNFANSYWLNEHVCWLGLHVEVNKQGSKPMNSHATPPTSKQISFLMCALISTGCYTSWPRYHVCNKCEITAL